MLVVHVVHRGFGPPFQVPPSGRWPALSPRRSRALETQPPRFLAALLDMIRLELGGVGSMQYDDFAAAEKRGWSEDTRAEAYVDLFAPISDQLIPWLVEAAKAAPGKTVLDLCCGHGNAAEALVATGSLVTGLDFSPAMLALARRRVPKASFVEGDAASLPFEDGRFDAVVCNVGFGHLPEPALVLSEIARVLKPGGIAAMTSWREPEFSASFQIVFGAVREHGDLALGAAGSRLSPFFKAAGRRQGARRSGVFRPRVHGHRVRFPLFGPRRVRRRFRARHRPCSDAYRRPIAFGPCRHPRSNDRPGGE